MKNDINESINNIAEAINNFGIIYILINQGRFSEAMKYMEKQKKTHNTKKE